MWRGPGDTGADDAPRRDGHRFAVAVAACLMLGAGLATAWSVTRVGSGSFLDASADAMAGDPGSGWEPRADRGWESQLVRITTDRCTDTIQGSGVVVDGRVWTNRHVVAGARRVRLTLASGEVVTASAVAVASDVDVAVVDAPGLGAGLTVAATPTGATTLAGFPGGGDLRARPATVVGDHRGWGDRDPARPLELDVAVVPGESGSPLVDARDRVAALLYARSEPDGGGLAIGSDEVSAAVAAARPVPATSC